MKKLILGVILTIGLFSCKKEVVVSAFGTKCGKVVSKSGGFFITLTGQYVPQYGYLILFDDSSSKKVYS